MYLMLTHYSYMQQHAFHKWAFGHLTLDKCPSFQLNKHMTLILHITNGNNFQ
jgi:hypothetical protein